MSSNIATELLPCPFCRHAKPELETTLKGQYRWFVICEYGCKSQTNFYELPKEAHDAWNQRGAPSVSKETKTEDLGKPDANSDSVEASPQIALQCIPLPEDIDFRNPWPTRCDMLEGPCACGAWHKIEDLKWRIENQLYAHSERMERVLSEHGVNSPAAGASPKTSAPSEPASGKFKMSIFEELINANQAAADYLEKFPVGSFEFELFVRLQLAIERAAK